MNPGMNERSSMSNMVSSDYQMLKCETAKVKFIIQVISGNG